MWTWLKHWVQSARDEAGAGGLLLLLTALLLWGAYEWLQPTPPKRLVLATGPEQGAYAEFGKRYAERLARYGVAVELRTTQGSADNLRLLKDGASGVDAAFVQGGSGEAILAIDDAPAAQPLASLGSLFHEPVWLFYRTSAARRLNREAQLTQLTQLAGWRVNIGAAGSGAPPLWAKLLHANRIDAASITTSQLAPTPAVVAFLAGELDAILFVSAPESLLVQMLLQTPGVNLLDFPQAEAYARRFPFLSPVTLPRGVVNLALDAPARNVNLIAPTASLLARADTHPALVQLLVQAAQATHGATGWFARAGTFPNAQAVEFPLAAEAARFYRSGPPLLQRYLPFWLANLIDRMWVALVSIIAVLIPLTRVVPPLYEFRIRSRVFRWYRQLREIEEGIAAGQPPPRLLTDLDDLDARVERINVPLSHADELYALRSNIIMVRKRLKAAIAPG